MKEINFDCPACRQNIEAPPEMAGHVVECPACEKPIVIPHPGGQAGVYSGQAPEQKPVLAGPPSTPEPSPGAVSAPVAEAPPATPQAPAASTGRKRIVLGKTRGKQVPTASRTSTGTTPRSDDPKRLHADGAEAPQEKSPSPKSRTVTLLLFLFLGALGIHRFYVGKIGTGFLFIITFGGLGIWGLADFIMIVIGAFRDANGRLVKNW
jgi:TM2 domain-containing membrane protein YozV